MSERIVILPLEYDKDHLQFLSQSIQDMLMRELGLSKKYTVISKQSSRLAAQESINVSDVGAQLNVKGVIKGIISEEANGILVNLRYHRLDSDDVEEVSVSASKDGIFKLGENCLKATLELLHIKDDQGTSKAVSRLSHPELYQKFLLGNHHFNRWTEENVSEAILLFKEVIQREPNFAPAYLKLAKCYIFQAGRGFENPDTVYPLARKAIEKALIIQPGSGEALIDKNLIDFFYDLDWRNIYSSIEEGLANYVDASEAYQQLSFFWYGLKEYDAALDALYSALEYDPLSTGILNMIGDVQLSAHRLDDSERTFKSILKMVPNDSASLENLLYIYSLKGEEKTAYRYLRMLEKALPDPLSYVPRMGYFYGKFGYQEEAESYLNYFEQLEKKEPNRVHYNYKAHVYAGRGDWEKVIDLIEKAWKSRTGILYILTDPQLAPVRKWKRYQLMVSQIWLPDSIENVDYITLKTDIKETVRVNLKTLLFVKAEDNYSKLYFFQNFRLEEKLVRATLKTVEQQLPNCFIRVHRTFILNVTHPFQVFGNSKTRHITQTQHDIEIPISRSFDLSILPADPESDH
ncbi:MAG: LytTR family transcriptional regulator DNA-binding domain-containing protein [Bacteroidota bacterium]